MLLLKRHSPRAWFGIFCRPAFGLAGRAHPQSHALRASGAFDQAFCIYPTGGRWFARCSLRVGSNGFRHYYELPAAGRFLGRAKMVGRNTRLEHTVSAALVPGGNGGVDGPVRGELFEWLPIGLPGSIASVASQRAGGPMLEAFVVGVFATLLATPCSAPFVGIAVGFCVGARAVRNLCNRRVFSASE